MRVLLLIGLLTGIAGFLFADWPDSQDAVRPSRPVHSRNPNTLDDVIIVEGFDDTPDGYLPPGWTRVDIDSGHGAQQPFYGGLTVWQSLGRVGWPTHSGGRTGIIAYNATGAPNNDWMITPRQDTLVAPVTLDYWASAQDANFPETFEVRVSTTDAQPSSFTHLVRYVHRIGRPWTHYTDDLSQFAGAPFYIAFHYCAVDDFALKLDDILLTATRPSAASVRPEPAQSFCFTGNYPNPFNSRTEFRFELARPARVKFSLYNTLGQKAADIAESGFEAGVHSVPFDAGTLSSGIYIARLTAGSEVQSRKLVLIR